LAIIATPLAPSLASAVPTGHAQIKHVLLISVDGMHQSDLDWYVAHYPNSELARLATGGAEYTDAQTSDPSDSDPGGTALMTGGDPKVTGIYYDDEYSHGVFPPGTTNCSGPVPGGNVIYDSPDDKLPAPCRTCCITGAAIPSPRSMRAARSTRAALTKTRA
jgi:hypothetical protein